MTSSLKLGIAGLAVVGVGLGAYLVNSGLKSNKTPDPVKLASAENGLTPAEPQVEEPKATPAMEPVSAPPAPTTPVASTSDHTGQAASPAPLGVRDGAQDTERTWRPKPLETSEAQPTSPAPDSAVTDVADVVRTEAPSTANLTSPAPVQAPDAGRMTLQEQPTATSPANADQAAVKPANPASEKMTTHVVQAGDTFSGLAAKYLGSPRHVKLIEKANPKINPNRLYVGTKLKIPAAPETKAAPAANTSGSVATVEQKAKTIKAPPVDPAKAYTVKPGDSWASLSSQHLGDSNWTVLYEHNKERFPPNVRTLQPGMVIEIPSKAELAGK